MNESTLQAPHAAPADPDLAEQAQPGHGIPPQDPNAGAHVALAPGESEREAKSVMRGDCRGFGLSDQPESGYSYDTLADDLQRVMDQCGLQDVTLVNHGAADAIVPLEGWGQRTHRAVPQSKLIVVSGAPHGLNVSHAGAFNDALLSFLQD